MIVLLHVTSSQGTHQVAHQRRESHVTLQLPFLLPLPLDRLLEYKVPLVYLESVVGVLVSQEH